MPAAKLEMGRPNQRLRTRKDLLQAAARLTKSGTKPSLEDVAEEALVSRATAYRYFPSIEALLLEAALDIATPQAPDVFNGAPADDPIARLERLDLAFDEMMNANEATLRLFLANALERAAKGEAGEPLRQNRRSPLIEAALEPARKDFRPRDLDTLAKALALVVASTEAMIVFKDVLRVDDAEARRVKRWAVRALVDAARK